MLRSFQVANHKSIRDEQELMLLPAYDKQREAVPVAAVFGANASGKSTLLDALLWMRGAVLDSFAAWQPGAGVPRTPFRLDAVRDRPSSYAVELLLDGVRYLYGFEVDDERVLQEWLYSYPQKRRRMLFEREGGTIRLGPSLPDARSREETLSGLTRDNTLLLSVAAHSNQQEVLPVYEWLRSRLRVADQSPARTVADLIERLGAGPDTRRATLALIRSADLGIQDVQVVHGADNDTLRKMRDDIDRVREIRLSAVRLLGTTTEVGGHSSEETKREAQIVLQDLGAVEAKMESELQRAEAAQNDPRSLRFIHRGGATPLAFDDESAGTRTWLGMLSVTLDLLEHGGMLVVDELDQSLHPRLSAGLVNLFRDEATNPKGAQFLFTTHDVTLLDEDSLARDEVWFIEKDGDTGASRLYPLSDFHPRKNENTERRYLAGSYGAVPVFSDIEVRNALGGHDDAA
jgi:predicted ATPase